MVLPIGEYVFRTKTHSATMESLRTHQRPLSPSQRDDKKRADLGIRVLVRMFNLSREIFMYYQQGDVLLFKEAETILDTIPTGTDVLVKGNNNHVVVGGEIRILNSLHYVKSDGNTTIVHPEHNPITLPEGMYRLQIVKEYNHWEEEAREVQD